ncbi:MAG TPA: copper homeostasis membrane protein CopD [Xanthobacteraceae bacterium]|nr:copper homeostasis membrane protein CopD [Xanthobacteraceae bacterium]
MDELIIASRAVHFAAVALLFGAPLFRLAMAPKQAGFVASRSLEIGAAIAALVSGIGWFAGVAADMAGSWADAATPDILQAVTFDTRFGHLWIARLVLLLALIAVQALGHPSRARDALLAVLAAAFAASLVGVGHGMTGAGHGAGISRLHMLADMVHLLCAAGWIGGLVCLGLLLHRAIGGRVTPDVARAAVRRFSVMGYWAVALLLISGCINAVVLVPSPASLIESDYGRALLIKLTLVAVMVAVALRNRLVLTPQIMGAAPGGGLKSLWRSVAAEQGIGLMVLAAAAWLGTIHPGP